MAIKSRLLSKLKFTYMTTTAAAAAHPQKLRPVLHNLEEARELCRRGLKGNAYAKYGEIFDGLIMAVKQILSGEAGSEAGEVVSLCKDLLQHVVTEIGKEDHFKKEMVFLPYKASMWDSLESVWRAAYEDKDNCLAYVVPIPYCDRNPDGTAKEWHCERDLFPKDVPTLDWQEVDLKGMHPDVIFIHNPYDDCNTVTSVDKIYYSRNLKEYTNLLVFVPYFVLGDTVSEGFSQTPALYSANYVILQNERIKFQFQKYYQGQDKDKFLAMGSPKIDKVLKSRKENSYIPTSWQNKIGTKKVLLFNTTLGVYLLFREKTLVKLKKILAYMKGREDILLWWRPHPLLKATFHSLCPELKDEYDSIVAKYQEEDWGIYDDSADLHRALAYCDAYYGDGSSVLWIYQTTGKPALLQDCSGRVLSMPLIFNYDFDEDGYVWYKPLSMNRLYRGEIATGKVEYTDFASELWSEASTLRWDFTQPCCCNGHVVLFPDNAAYLLDYEVATGRWKKVYVDEENPWYEWIFMGAAAYREKVIMYGNNGIAIYNTKTSEIEYSCKILDIDGKVYSLPGRQASYGAICAEHLWLPTMQLGVILSLDLKSWRLEKHIIEPQNALWTYITATDNCLWLLSCGTLIVSVNLLTGKQTEYVVEPFKQGGEIFYSAMFYTGKYILCMPVADNPSAKNIVLFDPLTGEKRLLACEHDDGMSGVDFSVQKTDGTVVGHYGGDHSLIVVDREGNVRREMLPLDNDLCANWEKEYTLSGKKHTIHEWEGAELGTFLDDVVLSTGKAQKDVTDYGNNIYKWAMRVAKNHG